MSCKHLVYTATFILLFCPTSFPLVTLLKNATPTILYYVLLLYALFIFLTDAMLTNSPSVNSSNQCVGIFKNILVSKMLCAFSIEIGLNWERLRDFSVTQPIWFNFKVKAQSQWFWKIPCCPSMFLKHMSLQSSCPKITNVTLEQVVLVDQFRKYVLDRN